MCELVGLEVTGLKRVRIGSVSWASCRGAVALPARQGKILTPENSKMAEAADCKMLEAFVAERDWAQFHSPKNLAMGVAIEAAEIMEHFLW